jgi:hypothetical protein
LTSREAYQTIIANRFDRIPLILQSISMSGMFVCKNLE